MKNVIFILIAAAGIYVATEVLGFSFERIALILSILAVTFLFNTVNDLKSEVEDLQTRVSELEPDVDLLEGWPPTTPS